MMTSCERFDTIKNLPKRLMLVRLEISTRIHNRALPSPLSSYPFPRLTKTTDPILSMLLRWANDRLLDLLSGPDSLMHNLGDLGIVLNIPSIFNAGDRKAGERGTGRKPCTGVGAAMEPVVQRERSRLAGEPDG